MNVTEEMIEAGARALAKQAWGRLYRSDAGFAAMNYPNGVEQYSDKQWPIYADDARAVVAAISAGEAVQPVAGVVGEWQFIESAPRDGTRILLDTGKGIAVAKWLDNSKTSHPWEGWHTDIGAFRDHGAFVWMPFPSSAFVTPATDGGEG